MDRRSEAVLPPDLFEDPSVLQALAERDFSILFRTAHQHGISHYRLGLACGMKRERVSAIALGRGKTRVTSIDTIERIADGLRIPGALLGLAPRPWETTNAPPDHPDEAHEGDDDMKRRQLLRGAVAVGLATTPSEALASSRDAVNQGLAATAAADLDHWEQAAEHYSYGYRGRPPAEMRANLAADLHALRPLFRIPLTASDRTRLCRTTAQLAAMTAIVLHDVGDRKEAAHWFHTAGAAAAESGDRALHAWILARHAMVPLNFGAPRAAVILADQARKTAGGGVTAAAALGAAVAARSYALSGNHTEAMTALADAERIANKLTDAQRADTWFGYGRQKEQVHLSHALTTLGLTRRARESQSRALELSAPTSSMTRGLLQLDAATCWHHDGNTDQACRAATAALTHLPPGWRTGLTRTRALDLYRTIPDQYLAEPAARDFRDALAAN
ncbi:hypothetical protein [Streptomyces sp. SID1121]|uniref:hypothetical protein n=1 Tax=Streptomyces sp. SID1121 TaxID=3425888 RepID=UPI004056DECD